MRVLSRLAPRALLTAVCQDAGYVERHYELLAGLDSLVPVTAEDYLFLGLARASEAPEQGLAATDEAIRRGDSSVVRALRARVRAFAAMGTGDPSLARLAVEDARIAKAMLPDSPLALAQDLYSQLAAAGTFEGPGHANQREAALAQAGRDARALEGIKSLPIASTARLWYFRETGDHAAALAEALDRLRSGVRMSRIDEFFLAMELYHHGEFRPALTAFDRIIAEGGDTSAFQVTRWFVLAELPDGPARALEAYRELTPRDSYAIYAPTILQLLGRKDEAIAAHLAVREQALRTPVRTAWGDRLREFNAGLIPVGELLAAAGTSRLNRCEAHFFIGMALLADSDRDGARDHFRRSVATHVFWFLDHVWSRAFVARLERDPTWPPWIPVKE